MKQSRRQLLKSAGVLCAAPAALFGRAAAARPPLAFSTLGCPKWEWKTILRRASEWGYQGIELRGIQGEMDLTRRPEFIGDRLKESRKDLAALNLRISDLGASTRLHEREKEKRVKQIDEARRFIELAQKLKAPYVRIFGDNLVSGEAKQVTVDRIIGGLREVGLLARGSGVGVLLETHGDFADSPTMVQMMKGADMPEIGVLWDTHHTYLTGNEQPADTLKQIGKYVRHVHIKDSIQGEKELRYVLLGTGRLPVREIVKQLVRNRYSGYCSFEWEKGWHPEIEEPEVAFPHYAKMMNQYFSESG